MSCPVFPRPETLPFAADRTAGWTALRRVGDVSVSEQGGVYMITGADAVDAAAKNPQVFSSAGAFGVTGSPLPLVPIAYDPPEHTRYRQMLDKFFSPRSMAQREAELRKQVATLIDGIAATGGTCDVVQALTVPYPSQVFLTLFGLPLEDRDRLVEWKDAIVRIADLGSSEPTPEALGQAAQLYTYLSAYVDKRRGGDVGTDLLSQLIGDSGHGGMTNEEILGLCFIFVIAGLDTVTAALGFALNALAEDPVRRERVVADPAAMTHFIEEVLRVEAPAPFAPRLTTRDVELNGVMIPAGSTCWLSFGAANRDERRFATPDTITDERANHFSFGRGSHRCLGSHLARLEIRLCIEEWHKRIPEYSLAEPTETVWPSVTMTLRRLALNIG